MTLVDNRYIDEFQTDYIVYFKHHDTEYASVEHYYQSKKTIVPDISDIIRMARTTEEAFQLGNRFILRSDWEEVKNQYMFEANYLKFSQNANLKNLLLNTKGYIEFIYEDNYWGTQKGKKDEDGKNILGNILCALRAYFRNDMDTFSRYSIQLNIQLV